MRGGRRGGLLCLVLAHAPQGNALALVVDRLDLHEDGLAFLDHLARVLDVPVGERRDVNEAVHAGEQLDEGAERLQAHHLPGEPLSFLELGAGGIPRILLERAQGERDALVALLVGLHAQDLHADLLPLLHHVLGVGDAGMATRS